MAVRFPMLQKYLIADLPQAIDLLPHLRRLDKTRWYSNFGPLATAFEATIQGLLAAADPAPRSGKIHVTTMSTGYHALEVGLRMMGIGAGSKVLIPAVTFPACPLAAQFTGAEAILADVDPVTWMLSPDTARRVAEKTKIDAVMPVALYGVPVAVDGWNAFTRDTGIPVIIDAAAAIETQAIPRHGLVAHSLHATKPFGVGEGGLLVGRSRNLITEARIYSNFGTFDRIASVAGSNTKMSEYHAAVGLQQAARWDSIKKKRRKIFELYMKHLEPLSAQLSLQPGIDGAVVSTLMLRSQTPLAQKMIVSGKKRGIAFHRMYLPPLFHHPYFVHVRVANRDGVILAGDAGNKLKNAHMPASIAMRDHILGVPFHPFLKESDIRQVVLVLKSLLAL